MFRKRKREIVEREKMARLDAAGAEIDDLVERSHRVTRILDERQRRNHWREAIEQMIQGAT